jgi:NADH dehydrogenase
MSKLVTIFGGSGFVGRYIVRHMAKEGWRVRVAVRRPNEALFVKSNGAVGQVEPVFCNIRDDQLVRDALQGADAVVNCVATFDVGGKNSFDAVQLKGAERIARIAAELNLEKMVHLSGLGADEEGQSAYAQTKAAGEAAILAHMPDAMILRPSVIFGTEDQFFNRFAGMSKFGPILPIAGAGSRFQPVYVDDVAKAAVRGILGQAPGGIYELGGPDVASLGDLMHQMLAVIQRRRLVLNLPFFAARLMALGFDSAQTLSLGLFHNGVLTRDQVKQLAEDNVVSETAKGFADLGIDPTPMASVLPDYLWRYRPSGQYAEIKASAGNLRADN